MTMFLLPKDADITVYAPFGKIGASNSGGRWHDTKPWIHKKTTKEVILEKHQVWDIVAVLNKREDVPGWAAENIRNSRNPNETFVFWFQKDGRKIYCMVEGALKYLD
jgi:hypothetical protein